MLDFETLRRPLKPNHYLLSDVKKSRPHGPAPEFPGTVEAVQSALKEIISAEPRVELVEADPGGVHWRVIQRTKLLGFADDITLQFLPSEERSAASTKVRIFSRARLGYSDMGVNRRRVKRWVAALRSALASSNQ